MLWGVAFVAIVVWMVAFGVFHAATGLVHLAFLPAVFAAVLDLVRERRIAR
jgi:hypothetical protein